MAARRVRWFPAPEASPPPSPQTTSLSLSPLPPSGGVPAALGTPVAVGLCGSAAAGAQAAEFAGASVVAMRRLPASVVGGVSAFWGAGDSGLRPLLSPAIPEAAAPLSSFLPPFLLCSL
ncbi:Os11g0296250 [Oryza sativa Japonica Group]|uniref:Os11g0296250 protein n=1 Tax=Oryza sativa subsp. japonica TaxID=39947 RepID=A0A0P0Y192_ORYSJ|nr:Os11g0296250 [Oryza sativa Japonica Group]